MTRPQQSAQRRRPLVIGLVGGIGSGKSRVAGLLAQRGARIISGDHLGHQALEQPDVKEEIIARWGEEVLDEIGEIDRKKLGAIVFADPSERRALEAIVHPWIKGRIRAEVELARGDPAVRLIVLDAAVMLEAGWHDVCDELVFVDAPGQERLKRLQEQRDWSAEELSARERAQLPLTEKRARADHVLDNSATLPDLERQVNSLLLQWCEGPDRKNQAQPSRLGEK
jgi:dephospho-CoA kinase